MSNSETNIIIEKYRSELLDEIRNTTDLAFLEWLYVYSKSYKESVNERINH